MAPSKRLLPWSNDAAGDGSELSRPRRRWRSLVLELRGRRTTMKGAFRFRDIMGEEFMSMFLPSFGKMVRRVVSDEVEKALFRQFNAPAGPSPPRLLVGWNQRPRYQLMFLNDLKPVYTMTKLEAKDGPALKVAIVERLANNQTKIVRIGQFSSIKVEVVVLHGDFNAKNEEYWTTEDFNKRIVSAREKSAQLLTGNLTLKLNRGEAFLENATFTDNSSFTSTKMFRLGLRLVNASGERVLEGITQPFRVKERRVEGFEKHYPPLLDDMVWRLEKIGRNGAYHQALSSSGIDTVQKFLQSYVKNEQKLLQTFSKMPQASWKAIIGHATTCEVGCDLYSYEVKDCKLFFDAIHQLVGLKLGDCYKPIDQLNQVDKNLVETLKQVAYENMKDLQYDHKMVNNCPVPLHRFHTEGTSVLSNVLPNQQILNYGQYNSSLGEFSTSQGFESKEKFCSFQGATNASVDMSRFVQGQTSNDVQFSHQLVMNNVIPYNPSQVTALPGPRTTQLHIPNTGRTDFGPDASPAAAVHSNIQAGQVATQFGQYGQSKRSHFSEGSYSRFSLDSLLSTDAVMDMMQPHFQLPSNSENFSNQPDLWCNGQAITQSQKVVTASQPSRTNSFDSSSCEQLIQNFISQFSSSEGVHCSATPLSPRKWIKIKAALKLASVGRLSRASRRGPQRPPAMPRLVPTI